MTIEIDMIGGNCPVQAEGKIDGEPFYFRARWESWSLRIGGGKPAGDGLDVHGQDVIGTPKWYCEDDWPGGEFAAGWMTEDQARELIEAGAAKWRADQATKP